jgi:alanyl-tRNA synthetase
MDKEKLRKEFREEWEKHYKVTALIERGYTRQQCKKCKRFFWAVEQKETCSDPSCIGYRFIGKKMAKEPLSYVQTWKKIEAYFTKNGHTSIKPYPSVARWRDDLYFTIASINDFQPYVVSGELDPIANPLIVPQPCIRFSDISNVGVTGRHYTNFVMVGQHAFNNKKTGLFYWKDEAITHDINYLNYLGINQENLVFIEDVWAGGGNFGPCIEYFAEGLELGNCVFMQYEVLPDGSSRELSTKVIDMGAGLERLAWITHSSPISYDIVFGPVVEKIKKKAGVSVDEKLFLEYAKLSGSLNTDEVNDIKKERQRIAEILGMTEDELLNTFAPLHAIYACADHLKTILLTSTDGMLPSNSGGGYNLRMILRRTFGFDERYSLYLDYPKIIEELAEFIVELFPHLKENVNATINIVEEERKKYLSSKEKSKTKVSNLLSSKKELSLDDLKLLYQSDGISPEMVAEFAKEKGVNIPIPENFYSLIKKGDEEIDEKKEVVDVEGLEKTSTLFYDLVEEFEATVVAVKGNYVILDKTAFYPEGGGQIYDIGFLNDVEVLEVKKEKGVILHKVKDPSKFKVGQKVFGKVDGERRRQIARHHTSIHLINACAREVLGSHIWQGGSYKDENKALRMQAEQKYGFRLYQGGAVPGKELRVVSIGDIDHQACGGTHSYNKSTLELGYIKIVKRESIQDGRERIIIKCGMPAVEYVQQKERILKDACTALSVPETTLKETIERFFNEWKERGKEIETLYKQIVKIYAEKEIAKAKDHLIKIENLELSPKLCEMIALEISKSGFSSVITNKDGYIVASCPKESNLSAIELLTKMNGKGGGNKEFARGKIITK